MVTTAQLGEYQRGQQSIDRLVRRDVRQLWDALGAIDPEQKRGYLLDMVPGLVNTYGPIAATLAAAFFADTVLREARIPAKDTTDKVRASTRAVIGGLWTGNEVLARDRLISSVVRHTRQYGRDTILESVRYSGGEVRYARILSYASKKGPCAWCRMLASRGAVYYSEVTAGGLNDWHETCNCDAVAVRSPEDFPSGVKGYDDIVVHEDTGAWMPNELFKEYDAVHEYLDDDKKVAAKMREAYGYT
ncbi:VG15 protein [Brachybacterium paraconglomeratum]|uniref:VG15 protein n=1 Tax=Brachybacterium paraconglomeratum TaxID=173362 RepID=UPI0022B031D3|nr:hypothetical protein [Brachybacterium paraconglomeratum]MCZ4325679.1 hypothetical protein [Brachybacterium paraconglomeratum]